MIIIDTFKHDNGEHETKAVLLFTDEEEAKYEFKALVKAACKDPKAVTAFLDAVNELDATL